MRPGLLHLLAGLLAIPFVVSQNSWFEWANSLWLLELQSEHVRAHLTPTFYMHEPGQFFYPMHLFYAGPTFSLLAYPAAVFGAWPVFGAVTVLSFIAASAGVGWAARSLGVEPAHAVIPGLLFATTPYLVSNLYGRGAWAELVALGALAIGLGAATSLLARKAEVRSPTTVALVAATAVVAGTHNLTLLFGGVLATLLLGAIAMSLGRTARPIRGRVAAVAGAAALGVCLCAVFLVPNLWLGPQTIAAQSSQNEGWLRTTAGWGQPAVVLNPFLSQPAGTANSDMHTESGVVALLWCVLAAVWLARRHALEPATRRSIALLAAIAVGLCVLMANSSWWLSFPSVLQSIQFTFRLVPYLALAICLGVAGLLAVPAVRRSRLLIGTLLVALAFQGLQALIQGVSATARSLPDTPTLAHNDVTAERPPPSFVGPGFNQPVQFRLEPGHTPRPIEAALAVAVGKDTPSVVALSGHQPAGTIVSTNIVDSPLIRFDGQARRIGRDDRSYVVLQVSGDAKPPWRATAVPACRSCLRALTGEAPIALLAGRILTLLALVAVFALIASILVRLKRERSDSKRGAGEPVPPLRQLKAS